MSARFRIVALALAGTIVLGACGTKKTTSSATTAATAASCTPATLHTLSKGTLTVATDKPAYPPYFENNDPKNGKGFESAVAYAIAAKLGYPPAQVKWVTEPFDSSYAPGPKTFDFDVNEISITPVRAKAVDFSAPYFQAPQAVVVAKGSKYVNATSLADLKGALIGVQIGTTSLAAVNASIKPTKQPRVFNNSNDVVTALKEHLVDAVVVDLPTAFYLTAAQVPTAKIAGQFSAPGGDRWGALLAKNSPLTSCVTRAIGQLRASGELGQITNRWMGGASAPQLS
ncbi:MAG TPA: ABC transporter substrate-binding protein [Solirubrobacteraceae bacterium]|nr:ABC transporter substrate-binding protein [Solirubrobacteraceae bacterium]